MRNIIICADSLDTSKALAKECLLRKEIKNLPGVEDIKSSNEGANALIDTCLIWNKNVSAIYATTRSKLPDSIRYGKSYFFRINGEMVGLRIVDGDVFTWYYDEIVY